MTEKFRSAKVGRKGESTKGFFELLAIGYWLLAGFPSNLAYLLTKMRDFKKLHVWQKGFDIAIQTYRFAATLPKHEQFGLISQMTRAGVSIPSNIAEGSSRHSD